MYLIARPLTQATKLIELLKQNNILAQHLPIVDIFYDNQALEQAVEQINQCSSALFISPSAIDGLGIRLIHLKPELKLITSGVASAKLLMEYNSGVNVIYPEHGSGVAELIIESKLANLGRIALIGGDNLNVRLAKYLEQKKIQYQFINLYQRVNCGLSNVPLLEGLMSRQDTHGIVITSCQIGDFLLECAAKSPIILECLQSTPLITIHPQITLTLRKYGLSNIYECVTAENLAIMAVIESLENERNREYHN